MIEMGVINRSASLHAFLVVIVRKKDGSNRICVDYRKLNKVTVSDLEPMTLMTELTQRLIGDRYFTNLDLSKDYRQIPVAPEDISKMAFVIPDGQYEFLKMPIGMMNSGVTLVRCMRTVLADLSNLEFYMDNVLIHSQDWTDHVMMASEVLRQLAEANLSSTI